MSTSNIVIMLLEEGDFRFTIEGDSITVTEWVIYLNKSYLLD
jgi:hypothetical protein